MTKPFVKTIIKIFPYTWAITQLPHPNKQRQGDEYKIGGDFQFPDIKLARAIADHASARIENVLLYRNRLQQAKMQTEMEMVKLIYGRFLKLQVIQMHMYGLVMVIVLLLGQYGELTLMM